MNVAYRVYADSVTQCRITARLEWIFHRRFAANPSLSFSITHERDSQMLGRYLLIISFIFGLALPSVLSADAAEEREGLAHIIQELQILEALIDKAETQRDRDARIRFRYDWLRQDIARIKLGLQTHLESPRTEPRTFPPLRGDYRR